MKNSKVLAACGVAWLAGATTAAAATHGPQLLPSSLSPSHYDLTLTPDAERLSFRGAVAITGRAVKPVRQVVLNAQGLVLDRATLDGQKAAHISLDDKLGRATLSFARPVGPGSHVLKMTYHGRISTGTLGFFAMDYESPAGKRRTLATNLEPTSARRVLPCWDEPAMKATFSVAVDAPADRMALSNMPAVGQTPLPDGRTRVRFAQTPKMSSYLLFVGVGDYERIHQDVDGVDVGVVVQRGDAPKAAVRARTGSGVAPRTTMSTSASAIPLPKLDLIAAPGQIQGFGSMENWGAILYFAVPRPVRSCRAPPRASARTCSRRRPRDGAPVVRRSRDHGLVGQSLAERGLRPLDADSCG